MRHTLPLLSLTIQLLQAFAMGVVAWLEGGAPGISVCDPIEDAMGVKFLVHLLKVPITTLNATIYTARI